MDIRKLNRREVITLIGGLAGTGAAASLYATTGQPVPAAPAASMQQVPWPYKPVDADAAAQLGYEGFWKGECMFASFNAIVHPVTEQLGEPYKSFPSMIFKYGGGGVKGWGTLCGALNGSAAAIQLLSPDPDPIINNLMAWYETESLPDVRAKGAKFPEVRSVAGTPLCHASIANWCKVSGKKAYSPERSERCALLAGSVARKSVQMLNDQAAGKQLVVFAPSKQVQGCSVCHEHGGLLENERTKMECGSCHQPLIKSGHGV